MLLKNKTHSEPTFLFGITCLGFLSLFLIWNIGHIPGQNVFGFPLDDAWIHMTYARNLLEDGLFAFNQGSPSTGTTSPLWVMCLATLRFFFFKQGLSSLISSVLILSSIFQVIATFLVYDIVIRLTKDTKVACLAALLMILCLYVQLTVLSGMEVALTEMLLLLAFSFFIRQWWFLSGVVLSLACLSRPEAAIVLTVLSLSLFIYKQHFKNILIFLLPSFILGGLWLHYNFMVSNHFLPATFYFKESTSILLLPKRLLFVLTNELLVTPPFWGGIGLIVFIGYFNVEHILIKNKFIYLPFILAGTYLLVSLFLLGHTMSGLYFARYLIPIYPFLIIGSVIGAILLGGYLETKQSVFLWILFVFAMIGYIINLHQFSEGFHLQVSVINNTQVKIGHWFAKHTPKDARVAAGDVGAVAYFSNREVIDLAGLNTPEFFWSKTIYRYHHPVVAFSANIPSWYLPGNTTTEETLQLVKNFSLDQFPMLTKKDKYYLEQGIYSCGSENNKNVIPLSLTKNAGGTFVRSFEIDCIPLNRWIGVSHLASL